MGASFSLSFSMVAGEASGDLLGNALLKGLRNRWPDLNASGIGGALMQEQGFHCLHNYEALAVHGFVDAIKNIRELLALRREIARMTITKKPDAFIGIDAPDFNFSLEKKIRQHGIKTIHMVSPSLWAWRGGRIHKIKKSTDLMLCLFPFEPEIYEKAGIEAHYVGHPLADQIPLEIDRKKAQIELGIYNNEKILIAILPGSRTAEINMLGPIFLETAKRLFKLRPHVHFVLPAAPGKLSMLKQFITRTGLHEQVTLVDGKAGQALAASHVALIASGTATLEAALYKRPMVVAYKISPATAFILKRIQWYYLPWYSLPNILCHETIVPERIQEDASPENLVLDILNWLDSPEKIKQLEIRFNELHQELRCNTGISASNAIAELLGR